MSKHARDRAESSETSAAQPCGCQDECLFRSSDDVRKGIVRGIDDFGAKEVEYSVINGMAIFEGDIALGRVEDVEQLSALLQDEFSGSPSRAKGIGLPSNDLQRGVAITGARFRWPGGIVPWEVVPSATRPELRDVVTQAIRHWEANTRIRFPERTAANAASFPNFVSFQVLDGCFSAVGMQGGPQAISLGVGCGFGQAVHEIGHAVGLWHEQSREDRDRSVRVRWENIQPGREHNFNQHITDGDDIGGYDFGSNMHYGATAFTRNGQPTIETLTGQPIGQRGGLSAGDIAAVRALYPQLEPSQSWNGVQFSGNLSAGQSSSWFTHSWPSHWYVNWSVVPTAPPADGNAQIEWTLGVCRQSDTLLKYFITVRNLTSTQVSFERVTMSSVGSQQHEMSHRPLVWENPLMNTKSRPNISSPSALDNRDLDGGPAGNFENGNQASATAALQDAGGPSPSLIESINQAEQGKLEGDLFPLEDADLDGGRAPME